MPRAAKTSKSTTDIKPYIRSSTSPSPSLPASDPVSQDDTSPSKRKAPKAKVAKVNKAWTNDELIQLFETVGKHGAGRKTWEGAVEGRTPNQCYQAWIGTVAPYLKKALANKATR